MSRTMCSRSALQPEGLTAYDFSTMTQKKKIYGSLLRTRISRDYYRTRSCHWKYAAFSNGPKVDASALKR